MSSNGSMLLWILFGGLFMSAKGANILGIFPIPATSHYIMFERLVVRLAEKGHYVDVLTHFPSKEVPPRYNQLSLAGSLPIFTNNISVDLVNDFSHYELVYFMTKKNGLDHCKTTLETQVLKKLKNTTKKYDLVITQIFGPDCMLGFGYYFNAPTVSLISSVSLPWAGDRVGNPDNPSYIPTYFWASSTRMGLYERIKNTVFLLTSKFLFYYFSSKESNRISRDFFGENLPSLENLALNTSLILVNSHFSFSQPRPTVPNFIEVGGLHIKEPKPLSKYFENLVKTDTKGIIYLTMGSLIVIESFSFDKLQGLFDAFAELPYKVLWKANRDKFPNGLKIPNNIHFENWMPQIDILCHSNVKLFVSHGGLLGTQEGIYCGVPRLGIPLFADQKYNIAALERLGIAIKVAYKDINKKTILSAARKLLEDPSFKQNAEEASRRFKDRPMSPLDTAVYWIEYVIRYKGAPHLRSPGADLPWYQYYLIDVGSVLILGLSVVIMVLIAIFRLILRFLWRDNDKKKRN